MKTQIIIPTILIATLLAGGLKAQNTNTSTKTSTTTTVTTNTEDSTNNANKTVQQNTAPQPVPVTDEAKPTFPKFYIGAQFMPTFTKFKVKTVDDGVAQTSFIVGYGVGGYLGYNFTKNVALQAEAMYSVLSQKYTDKNVEKRIDLSYLNIPLLLKLNTDVSKPVNLNLCIGPQIGINLGSKVDAKGTNGVDTVAAVIAVKPFDIGFAYGAGLDFRLSPALTLGLGFRGVYGVLDISDNSKTTTTNQYYILDRSHVKTYAGYVGLGVNF